MHEYTINYHDRKSVHYFLAILSTILSPFVAHMVSQLSSLSNLSLLAPSGLVIFSILFIIFDIFLWKLSLLYRLGIIKIPNLHGNRNGYILSSNDDSQKIPVKITIHQTYSKMRIRLETEVSRSFSLMAVIEMVDPTCFNLRWEYLAEYMPDKKTVKARHYGVTNLILRGYDSRFHDKQEASYYTEFGRDTHGKIFLESKDK